MLPFTPQSEKILKNRFHLAIKNVYDVMSDKLRPGINPDCVFDFSDGLRMIISKDKVYDEVYIHITASFNPLDWKDDFYTKLKTICEEDGEEAAQKEFKRVVEKRFRMLSGYERKIEFVGLSPGKIDIDKFEGGLK